MTMMSTRTPIPITLIWNLSITRIQSIRRTVDLVTTTTTETITPTEAEAEATRTMLPLKPKLNECAKNVDNGMTNINSKPTLPPSYKVVTRTKVNGRCTNRLPFCPMCRPIPMDCPDLSKPPNLSRLSRAFKVTGEDGSSDGGRGVDERIVHEEVLADRGDRDPYKAWQDDVDVDRGFGSHDRYDDDESEGELDHRGNEDVEEAIASEVLLPYWPENLQQPDFRGPQGIMCVGNAYTIATAVPLYDNESDAAAKAAAVVPLDPTATTTPTGPYREYRAELGIQSKALRFRIKLNYAVPTSASSAAVPGDSSSSTTDVPPLVLKTLVVCREARGLWPRPGKRRSVPDRWSEDGLYGPPGAPGGLYDPPPIDAAQATQYLLLDLEGRATALFPYQMDQSPNAFGGTGWVASLDWTPDSMRFQVDRKVHGGAGILGLKTLELSEVQSEDADKYRPRDGGQNMRQ